MSIASQPSQPSREGPDDYARLIDLIQGRLDDLFRGGNGAIFTTASPGLFEAYLAAMPEDSRQYHTCAACRRFFERYAGLVAIGEDGVARSAFWSLGDEVPAYYAPAIRKVAALVDAAPVDGVFLSKDPVWGQPRTGDWTHYAVRPTITFAHPLLSAEQAMAEKREDRRVLDDALGVFREEHVAQALRLLEGDSLYRAEKVAGPVRWLGDLMATLKAAPRGRRDNLLWRAVASAPPGFCKPRGTMAGTLLEDLAAGMDFETISRRFAAKMHPLQYQRPQAAPTAGNIARGEAIVAQLGIAPSLRRRYATLADVQEWVWQPATPVPPAAGGVFGHLTPKGATPPATLVAGTTAITWEKFRRTVLPGAESIELRTSAGPDNYSALLTAADPDAPPILQWDSPDRRNSVSWYVWHGGAPAAQFGLPAAVWVRVVGITPSPTAWHGAKSSHFGNSVFLLLEGAADTRMEGNALFPECLKSELHEIRSTIEAFAKSSTVEAAPAGSPPAAGLMLSAGSGQGCRARLRVRAGGVEQEYTLDRWD